MEKDITKLISSLRRKGIEFHLNGGSVDIRGPLSILSKQTIRFLQQNKKALVDVVSQRLNIYPVATTELQKTYFYKWKSEVLNPAYNLVSITKLLADVDLGKLQNAVNIVVDRHYMLRSAFQEKNGELVKTVYPEMHNCIEIRYIDCDEQSALVVESFCDAPFDLEKGPLFRCLVIHKNIGGQGKTESEFCLVAHHIIMDFVAMQVFTSDVARAYDDLLKTPYKSTLAPVEYDFDDTIDDNCFTERTRSLDYWKSRFQGRKLVSGIPYEKPAVPSQAYNKAWKLSDQSLVQLNSFARESGTTLYTLILSVYFILSRLYTTDKSADIVVGVPSLRRNKPKQLKVVGSLVNTLPINIEADAFALPLVEFVNKIQRSVFAALQYDQIDYPDLVANLQLTKAQADSGLVNTIFNWHQIYDENKIYDLEKSYDEQILTEEIMSLSSGLKGAVTDLVFTVQMLGEGLQFRINYRSDLYSERRISALVDETQWLIKHLLTRSNESPNSIIAKRLRENLPSLDSIEKPPQTTVVDAFRGCVENAPDSIALVEGEQRISFSGLDAWSDELAAVLQAAGLQVQDRIGVYQQADSAMIASVLAILKIGGVYVPLERDYPAARLQVMAEDAQLAAIICREEAPGEFCPTIPRVIVDSVNPDELQGLPYEVPALTAQHPAYIIYTSGTTGVPKGVVAKHQGITRLVCNTNYIDIRSDDVFLQSTPISFDGATFDIWGPLLNGARLVLAPEILKDMHNLGHYYQQHGVTVVWLTSALFSTMVREHLDRMSTLRVCVAGGDVVSSEYVRQYLTRYPSSQFINGYGPTENTTFSSCYVIDDSAAVKDALPIGSPITGSCCYVLDEGLEPVAVGVPGELYVGGQGLASHYEGRAGLTAERFIPHPFANSGERLYRTGDIVRWNSDGALDFLGRRDDQIKLRGFRVELGEVNSALEALPAVAQSHAVVVTDERDTKRLVAYVAVGSRAPISEVGDGALEDGTVNEDILLQALKQTLPPYMVPVKLILLAEFPLTPNGKVDRRALPEVDFSGQVQGYEAPANPLEETLCQLWSRVLGCDEVGRHDNFFQLGGDSILAIQILSGLQALGESLSMQALYEHQTVAALADYIQGGADEDYETLAEGEPSSSLLVARAVNNARREGQSGEGEAVQTLVVWAGEQGGDEAHVAPLTPLQQGMLHTTLHTEGQDRYWIQTWFELRGNLDEDRWRQCWQQVWDSHAILRSRFIDVSAEHPLQLLNCPIALPWETLDWQAEDDIEHHFSQWLNEQKSAIPKPEQGPLVRFSVLRLSPQHWRFVWQYHHALLDGWSKSLLLEQAMTDYRDGVGQFTREENPHYGDYLDWLHSRDMSVAKTWWRDYLSDFDQPARLPQLSSRRGAAREGLLRVPLSAATRESLTRYSQSQGITLSTVMQGAWGLLLGRLCATADVVFGLTVSGRTATWPGANHCVGPFINTVPVRIRWDSHTPFTGMVNQLHRDRLACQPHELLGLLEIQKQNELGANVGLFDSLFVFENYPFDDILRSQQINDLQLGAVDGRNAVEYPIVLIVQPFDDHYELQLCFDESRLAPAEAGQLLAHYQSLLQTAMETPEQSAAQLNWQTEADAAAIDLWNQTAQPLAPQTTVVDAFRGCVENAPDSIALVEGEQHISFSRLDAWSDELAAVLQAAGLQVQDRIGVYQQADSAMIASVLAILKIGGVYVPLERDYPAARLQVMAEDAQLAAIICREEAPGEFCPTIPRVIVDTVNPDELQGLPYQVPALTAQHPAYIIYTSGTTGVPKGVVAKHQGITRLVCNTNYIDIRSDDVFLQSTPISFDGATFDIWGPLLNGARLVLAPEILKDMHNLGHYYQQHGVTVVWLTSALFSTMVREHLDRMSTLRVCVAGGDVVSSEYVRQYLTRYPSSQFINGYGPTENTTFSSCYVIDDSAAVKDALPIGSPITGSCCYVLDEGLEPVAVGVPGELYVGGQGLASHYEGRAGLTAERFIPHPFANSGERLYRTGDIVRWNSDGALDFLGRRDDQIKLRGFRVELGEVNSALEALPVVAQSHAVVVTDERDTKRLVAYVAVGSRAPISEVGDGALEDGTVNEDILLQALKQTLPPYMVPVKLILLAEFPLTPNGKVDRRALPEVDFSGQVQGYEAPANPLEETLCQLWSRVLGCDEVGRHDNFFQLGGDSILAIQILSGLQALGESLSMQALYEHQTVAALADYIQGGADEDYETLAEGEPSSSLLVARAVNNARREGQSGEGEAVQTLVVWAGEQGGDEAHVAPLTPLQQGMLHTTLHTEGQDRYWIQTWFELRGNLDEDRWRQCWQQVWDSHAILRSRFIDVSAEHPLQLLNCPIALPWETLDWQAEDDIEHHFSQWLNEQKSAIPKPEQGPLVRFSVLRLSPQHWRFVWQYHHALLDGWSKSLLLEQAMTDYRDGVGQFTREENPHYGDYLDWLHSRDMSVAKTWWRDYLSDFDQPARLPQLSSRRGAAREGLLRVPLSAATRESLTRYSQSQGITLSTVMQGAWGLLLGRLCATADVVFGLTVSGRTATWPGANHCVGPFINTVPVRIRWDSHTPFTGMVNQLHRDRLACQPHELLGLLEIQKQNELGANVGLFDSLFVFENYPFDDILRSQQINDLHLGAVDGRNAVEYPIVLIVQPFDDHYELQLCFDESRLAPAEAGQLLAHYQSLLQTAMENPEQSAAQLNWQTEADAAAIDLWNQTAQPLAPQTTVVDAFRGCVENAPDSIALVEGEQHISFSRLDAWSDELAAVLQAAGLQVQDRIGVYQQADSAMIASVLAILKIGGVYVPLERDYPAARLQVMAEDAQLAAIICREEAPGEFCPTIPRVFVDSVNPDELQGLPLEVPALTAQHPAYIIYTSGTTGVPKGSITTHGGYLNTARYYTKTCEVNSGSRVLQFASICFDSFMFEFFHMLVGGASYILRPSVERIIGSNLARFITVNHITHVTLTSSVISTLINEPLPSIEWILSGGESCNANLVKAFADRFHFINAYGPSEASISVCSLEFSHPQESISIGRPIDNTSLYILDELYNHVPVGGVGQIGIAGAGLAHGYQNNPRLTAEKFIPNPWSTDGQRLYLSGDLGFICCSDSLLHHVGRMDRQVKINGVRVELAEIESALRCIDVVKTCCVETTEVGQIIAFVCYEETNIHQRDNIKQQLRQHLPAHMVPAHIVVVEEMPLTENGKIDLAALNVLAAEYLENQRQNREFTSKIAVRIAELMEGVLKTKNITANDDFFSMGGHSISAMEMVAKLNDTFSVNISLVDFYDIPNPEALAAKIKGESISSNSCPTVKKIEPRFKHRFEPFPLTEIQRAYWLGRYLGEQDKAVSTHGYFEVDVVDAEFDVNRLGEAFKHTINKHDMMRMCLTRNGEQQCQPEVNHFSIDLEDISQFDSDGKRAVIEKIRNMLSHQVFDAFSFPLFEVRVTKLELDRFRLHFSMDAMLMDFSSVGVFFSDLALAYETNAPLEKLGLTFRDYQIAFEGMKQEDAYSQAKGYWQARLDGLPGAPELPVIASKSADNLFVRRSVTIPAEHWETIQTLARQFRLTPTSLLLSAYVEVIALWSASDHFCINLSLFNRHELDPDIHKIVGDFTSMNLTECCVDRTKTYLERIKILQYQLWSDIDHRLYSGVDVLRDINRQNDSASRINMPVVFTSALGVDFGIGVEEVRGGEYHIPTYSITQTSQVWIDCQAYETNGSCIVNWDVMENIFEPGVLDAMFECFEAHLLQLSNDSIYNKRKVVEAPASQLAQRASLVEERLYPIEHLHKATLESARDYPQNIAFVAGEQTITYADVERYVRYLGMQLHKTGLTANEPVAVIFRKGWQQHVAALAVLFAGGCYVPIDADLPSQRIANYLEEASIKVAVISPGENVAQLPLTSHNIIIFDERETQGQEVLQQQIECEVAGPAYIIFTSGSTGTPKGVAVSHQAAINTIFDINRMFAVTKDDVVFSISAFNFDLSVYDLFGLMRVGGRIVVPTKWEQKDPESWYAYLKKEQVTIWNSVPALFNLLIDYLESIGAQLPVSLRLVMLSGDWIPKDISQRAYKLNPNVKIISLGGATEAAIWSIYYPISQNEKFPRSIPYGKPLANQNIYVMKPDFTSCPTGVPGELMIAGEGLALGYWRDEEKTQHSFVHHPESGERLYQTGDYGRYLLDGNIEFLGRQDKQIKVSGHRVELGEIESVLDKHALVKRSIAILSADKQLIAYVQMYKPEDSTANFYDILRRHLESYLPDYMIPSYFVCLEGLPLNINGKVDYGALPEPERIKVSESSDSKYEDSILARIFADQLNLESVSPEDNFFQLGGDSLIAIQCVTKARSQGFSISIKDIFAQPTIGALEDFARGNENDNVNRSVIEPMVGAADSSTRNNALKEAGGTENPCIKGSSIENYPLFRGGQEDLYSSINIAQEHYALSPIEDIYPMTAIQQEMLLQSKVQPGRGNYIVQTTFEIQDKSFEFNIFYAAWQEIINRHAILRSQFIGADTRFPVQIVRQTVTAPVELNDWTNKQPDEQLFEYESYRYSDWVNGFDEGICGLSRVKVFKFNNDTYRILWTSHHCIGDGWAQAVITREMGEIYSSISEKSTYNLPTPVPFKRYVSWQAEQDVSLAKSYWKNLLQTEVVSKPLLKTTLNSIGLPEQGKQFEVRRKLSVLKTANLCELAKSQQFTVNLIIQATWALILSRYSNQSRVIFGATASGRPETIEQVEQIVGPFLNSYPVVADLDINKSFIDLANILKRQQMEKVKFEYVSLRQIASWVNSDQAQKLFSSLVIFNNYPKVDVQLGLKILHHVSQNNYPVTLVVYPSEQIEFVVKYNGFEYKEEQAELLLKHFLDMLDKVMQSPTEALSYFQLANTRNKRQKKLKLKELSL